MRRELGIRGLAHFRSNRPLPFKPMPCFAHFVKLRPDATGRRSLSEKLY
jgi:hypothetical protein